MKAKKLTFFILGILIFGILFYSLTIEMAAYRKELSDKRYEAQTEEQLPKNEQEFGIEE